MVRITAKDADGTVLQTTQLPEHDLPGNVAYWLAQDHIDSILVQHKDGTTVLYDKDDE